MLAMQLALAVPALKPHVVATASAVTARSMTAMAQRDKWA
jgi:hypothetical protein